MRKCRPGVFGSLPGTIRLLLAISDGASFTYAFMLVLSTQPKVVSSRHPDLIGWIVKVAARTRRRDTTCGPVLDFRCGPPVSGMSLASFENWSKVIGGMLGLLRSMAFWLHLPEGKHSMTRKNRRWSSSDARVAHRARYPKQFVRAKAKDLFDLAKSVGFRLPVMLSSTIPEGKISEFGRRIAVLRDRVFAVALGGDLDRR